jgi:hypothetical protein
MRWPELPERSDCDRAADALLGVRVDIYLRAHPSTGADSACRRFGSISPGAQRNGDACTTGDCGVGAVAYPGDAQLNSSRTTAKPTNEGAQLR